MISIQKKGRDFFGVVMYNQKKVNAGLGSILDSTINAGTVIQQTKEFNLVRQLKPNLAKAVYHVSLNLPYTDTLSDEAFANLAKDYLEGMGFEDNQYIIYKHTDQEHLHCHIVANRVKFSGEVVSDSQDYKRSEALVRKLEKKYHLTQLISKQESNLLSKGEIEKCLRTGKVPERLELQQIIFEVLNQHLSLKEFIQKLKEKNIAIKLNQSTTRYVSGISFKYKNITYKGSKIHKQLSWNNLKTKLNYEQIRNHSTVPEVTIGNRTNEKSTIGNFKTISGNGKENIAQPKLNLEENTGNKITSKPKFRFRP